MFKEIIALLKKDEGFRPYIYDDATGKKLRKGDVVRGTPTIGYGFTHMNKGDGKVLLERKVDEVLFTFDANFDQELWKKLSDKRKCVLVCMAYQLGFRGTMDFSKMIACLWAEDWNGAADEMMRSWWARQTPKRVRRMAEMMREGE